MLLSRVQGVFHTLTFYMMSKQKSATLHLEWVMEVIT